eukprot:1144466-Pelagomonas_calceolata.AAC.6
MGSNTPGPPNGVGTQWSSKIRTQWGSKTRMSCRYRCSGGGSCVQECKGLPGWKYDQCLSEALACCLLSVLYSTQECHHIPKPRMGGVNLGRAAGLK